MICTTKHVLPSWFLLFTMLCFYCTFLGTFQSFVETWNKCVFHIPTGGGLLTFLCCVMLKAEGSASISFSVLFFFENWTMAFSYSTNSMKRLGIPLVIPNSLHRRLFILIQLIYLLKIQHIFKHDCYTGMTLTIVSTLLYRTSHTCKVFSFVLQIFSQIQHSKCFLMMA